MSNEENEGGFVSHLTELRKRLIHSFIFLIIFFVICYIFADPPDQVIDAFRDVQAARADMERSKNEAEAYANDVIPRARGEAQKLL